MRFLIPAMVLGAAACGQGPSYRLSNEPLPVAPVELTQYLGLWHEQARLPNRAEDGCQRVTAEYDMLSEGLMSVRRSCLEVDGERRITTGRLRLAGRAGEGRLEINFAGPFWRDYWVIDRGRDYSWSIVAEPRGRHLWVLTRAERITPQQRAAFEQRISELGYRPADLVWVGR